MMCRSRNVVAGALALSLVAGPVFAAAPKSAAPKGPQAPACYSRVEHAAEQMLRLHTEIMTVGLYCKELKATDDPYGMYQKFTIAHRSDIAAAEKTLMDFYARGHGGKAMFDTFRTELANEASRRSAVINVGIYCHEHIDRVRDALALSNDQLKTITTDEGKAGLMALSSRPLCDTKVVSLPDPPEPEPAPVKAAPTKKAAPPAAKKAPAKPVKTAAK